MLVALVVASLRETLYVSWFESNTGTRQLKASIEILVLFYYLCFELPEMVMVFVSHSAGHRCWRPDIKRPAFLLKCCVKLAGMEWISVDDKLPEYNTRVLIIIGDRWEGLGKFTGDGWYEYQSEGLRKATLNFRVTHWQHFPPKPNDWRLLYNTEAPNVVTTDN